MQFPVNLNLDGRPCLVVGAGRIALRKTEQLLECAAAVTVLAPLVHDGFRTLPVSLIEREYRTGDAAGFRLVITATANLAVDQQIYDEAEALGIWVNSADDPDRCAFTLPAVVRRGSLMLTASTGGASPALSSWLRRRLEQDFGDEWATVVNDLALERARIHADGLSTEGLDWEPVIARVLADRIGAAEVAAK
ncbi:MAG: bifunctional precorrin-2 dehydrogenase/sirohydrochlorin ferrochelatase [Actinobacteria bacterium]|uniref:precorrin-2 dehydrogenase n=1 Tax=freshwater metagenome TaxID=449393 RepID=A0A6J7PZS5_9ZZZZ|nr:bifunctional precorrin-2 dehydrogenase/sirohydrochlorin ferrochelatase [Actinomycetota bacterium]